MAEGRTITIIQKGREEQPEILKLSILITNSLSSGNQGCFNGMFSRCSITVTEDGDVISTEQYYPFDNLYRMEFEVKKGSEIVINGSGFQYCVNAISSSCKATVMKGQETVVECSSEVSYRISSFNETAMFTIMFCQ